MLSFWQFCQKWVVPPPDGGITYPKVPETEETKILYLPVKIRGLWVYQRVFPRFGVQEKSNKKVTVSSEPYRGNGRVRQTLSLA